MIVFEQEILREGGKEIDSEREPANQTVETDCNMHKSETAKEAHRR